MAKRKAKPKGAAEQMETQVTSRKPNRTGVSLHVYIRADLRRMLDEVVDQSDPKTNATAVVETALRRYFTSIGKWPPPALGEV